MTSPNQTELIQQLENFSVLELNNATATDDALLAIVQAASAPLLARLYACEILLRRDETKFFDVIGRPTVAAIYVSAFRDRVTADLNGWAFLGLDEWGPLGRRLVACGETAVTELAPLLDVDRSAGLYGGSEESKEGNADRARVCDFAAFFIARIKQLPYRFHRDDIGLRDAEINRLKKDLF